MVPAGPVAAMTATCQERRRDGNMPVESAMFGGMELPFPGWKIAPRCADFRSPRSEPGLV